MNHKNIADIRKRARYHLERIQQLVDESPSPLRGLSKEEVIQALRRTREELWKEKIASSTRRQRVHLRTGTD